LRCSKSTTAFWTAFGVWRPSSVDELETIQGIERGLADFEAGRFVTLEVFEEEFRRK